ncbi:MAG TPA: DUF4097 family beta strand repeat-containing protein, partial [Vicinamibacterales bacterium]
VPAAAGAQVYPDRIVVKTRHVVSSAGYQRRDRGDAREEATDRTTRTFKLGTGGTLTLGNIAGDITVTRGSGSDTVVDIVKTAHGRDAADARDLLQIVTVDASERNGRAEVKAHYPGGDEMKRNGRRNLNVSIAYTVTAPAGIHLAVETISGNVKIADIKGDVTASSISGDVRISGGGRIGSAKSISGAVEILDGQVDGPLEASSVSGDVTVRRLSAQRVEAGSVSGNIHLEDLKCDRVEAHTTSGTIGFAGALARNGHYELKGFSGEIRVALSGGTGFDVDASSFSGQIRSDDYPITARGRLSGRHLTGTWGDGSAVLDLSTFSGSIVIAKR